MSVDLWAYAEGECDGGGCPGDCDLCDKWLCRDDGDVLCMLELEEEFDWGKIAESLKIHRGKKA